MFSKTFASKFNILISTFLFSSLIFSSDVEVMIDPNSFIDDGMGYVNFDLMVETSETIAGYQFNILSDNIMQIDNLSTVDNLSGDAGFTVSTNQFSIIGFSLIGGTISAGSDGILLNVTGSYNTEFIDNSVILFAEEDPENGHRLLFSGPGGTYLTSGWNPSEWVVGQGLIDEQICDDIDMDGICDEDDDCIGDIDDCGLCNGDGPTFECFNGNFVCDESECDNSPQIYCEGDEESNFEGWYCCSCNCQDFDDVVCLESEVFNENCSADCTEGLCSSDDDCLDGEFCDEGECQEEPCDDDCPNFDLLSDWEIEPEDFVDSNGNGVWDEGESYDDDNENGSWDDITGTVDELCEILVSWDQTDCLSDCQTEVYNDIMNFVNDCQACLLDDNFNCQDIFDESDCDDLDSDGVCDYEDDCVGDYDECGVCNGDGIADGACDCDGNVLDCAGECGGSTIEDDCGVCGGDIYLEDTCTDLACSMFPVEAFTPQECSTYASSIGASFGAYCDAEMHCLQDGCYCNNEECDWQQSKPEDSCGCSFDDLFTVDYLYEDCEGECGGSAIEDECGICGGDGSDCGTYNVDIFYNSVSDIAGFQFDVSGATIVGASGGDAAANGLTVSTSSTTNRVIGFSLTGSVVPAGSGILTVLEVEGSSDICIEDLILSTYGGQSLDASVEDCNSIIYEGCTDLDSDGICDDSDDCIGNYDECGVCNGDGSSCVNQCTDDDIATLDSVSSNFPEWDNSNVMLGCIWNCVNGGAEGDGVEWCIVNGCGWGDTFTEGCTDCYGEFGDCMQVNCDECNDLDGWDESCDECLEEQCWPEFESCSGVVYGCDEQDACNYEEGANMDAQLNFL